MGHCKLIKIPQIIARTRVCGFVVSSSPLFTSSHSLPGTYFDEESALEHRVLRNDADYVLYDKRCYLTCPPFCTRHISVRMPFLHTKTTNPQQHVRGKHALLPFTPSQLLVFRRFVVMFFFVVVGNQIALQARVPRVLR